MWIPNDDNIRTGTFARGLGVRVLGWDGCVVTNHGGGMGVK